MSGRRSMRVDGLQVDVLDDAAATIACALGELTRCRPGTLVSFATGGTYTALYRHLAAQPAALDGLCATHLDEYLDFAPARRGGMVHELTTACPPLADLLERNAFVPVPASGTDTALRDHEARLAALGGISLQFLGIGRNGHIAFNEPGTPFDLGFHRTPLAATTRHDAKSRFAPDEPPFEAVTAGARSILAARRIVLVAHGGAKAAAVRAMLHGPIDPACPASVIRRHPNALVLLDPPAAAELECRDGGATCR